MSVVLFSDIWRVTVLWREWYPNRPRRCSLKFKNLEFQDFPVEKRDHLSLLRIREIIRDKFHGGKASGKAKGGKGRARKKFVTGFSSGARNFRRERTLKLLPRLPLKARQGTGGGGGRAIEINRRNAKFRPVSTAICYNCEKVLLSRWSWGELVPHSNSATRAVHDFLCRQSTDKRRFYFSPPANAVPAKISYFARFAQPVLTNLAISFFPSSLSFLFLFFSFFSAMKPEGFIILFTQRNLRNRKQVGVSFSSFVT